MKRLNNFWEIYEQLPTEMRVIRQVADFATGVCHCEKNKHDDYFEQNRDDKGSSYDAGWWYAWHMMNNNNNE